MAEPLPLEQDDANAPVFIIPDSSWEPEFSALEQISKAQRLLESADNIRQIIKLRSLGAAAETFAIAQHFREVAQQAKIFQIKAEVKAGQWLLKNIPHQGGRPKRFPRDMVIDIPPELAPTLEELDIKPKDSMNWQREAQLPAEKLDKYFDTAISRGWEISRAGVLKLAEAVADKDASAKSGEPIDIIRLRGMLPRWFNRAQDKKKYEKAEKLINELIRMIKERDELLKNPQ